MDGKIYRYAFLFCRFAEDLETRPDETLSSSGNEETSAQSPVSKRKEPESNPKLPEFFSMPRGPERALAELKFYDTEGKGIYQGDLAGDPRKSDIVEIPDNWKSVSQYIIGVAERNLDRVSGGKTQLVNGVRTQGQGRGRVVYNLGEKLVLKVAYQPEGMEDNFRESMLSGDPSFANVYDISRNPLGAWVVAEKLEPFDSEDAFKMMTGLSVIGLQAMKKVFRNRRRIQMDPNRFPAWFMPKVDFKGLTEYEVQEIKAPEAEKMVRDLFETRNAFDMFYPDLSNYQHWGISKVDGKIKTYDYGSSQEQIERQRGIR
jgi:hypothetical protein